MSTRLAAEQERARQAHDRLAEATTGHAVEIDLIGRQAQQRIAAAQTERDTAVQAAETARDAALNQAHERGQEAQQATQRAAVAKAEAAPAEATRIRQDATRELGQAARARDTKQPPAEAPPRGTVNRGGRERSGRAGRRGSRRGCTYR